jgi:uncharacterized membrane protein
MEEAIAIVAIVLGVLGCGLMAGVFFAFSTFVMKALAAIPPSEAIRAMQAINRVIVRTAFMPIFIGTAVLCLGYWLARCSDFWRLTVRGCLWGASHISSAALA